MDLFSSSTRLHMRSQRSIAFEQLPFCCAAYRRERGTTAGKVGNRSRDVCFFSMFDFISALMICKGVPRRTTELESNKEKETTKLIVFFSLVNTSKFYIAVFLNYDYLN